MDYQGTGRIAATLVLFFKNLFVPSLTLVTQREYHRAIDRRKVVVKSDVPGAPARDHQFTHPFFGGPANQWMLLQHSNRMHDGLRGRNSCVRLVSGKEILDAFKITQRARRVRDARHAPT